MLTHFGKLHCFLQDSEDEQIDEGGEFDEDQENDVDEEDDNDVVIIGKIFFLLIY